jgi:hypothetical protein
LRGPLERREQAPGRCRCSYPPAGFGSTITQMSLLQFLSPRPMLPLNHAALASDGNRADDPRRRPLPAH